MKTIAERIKTGLELRNMKQADLVEKTGIGKSSISTYISGEYEPKQRNIYKIALALDVNESWLMGYDVPMERKTTVTVTKEEEFLLKDFQKLNSAGKHKAADYVSDLAENPKYRLIPEVQEDETPYVPEVLAAHHKTGKLSDSNRETIDRAVQFIGELKKKEE